VSELEDIFGVIVGKRSTFRSHVSLFVRAWSSQPPFQGLFLVGWGCVFEDVRNRVKNIASVVPINAERARIIAFQATFP
jgi:hypothetical protein